MWKRNVLLYLLWKGKEMIGGVEKYLAMEKKDEPLFYDEHGAWYLIKRIDVYDIYFVVNHKRESTYVIVDGRVSQIVGFPKTYEDSLKILDLLIKKEK